MNQFGLVQTVDCFSQRVVITIAAATNRGLDARFGQPLAIANANVLGGLCRSDVSTFHRRLGAAHKVPVQVHPERNL
jgi:hypothetical protein